MATIGEISCAARFAAGLLNLEEWSEEEDEEVGGCAGDGSSWTCWVRSCCAAWTAGGAATGAAAAAPRAGVHAVPAVRSLFLGIEECGLRRGRGDLPL